MCFLSVLWNGILEELTNIIVNQIVRVISFLYLGDLLGRINKTLFSAFSNNNDAVLLLLKSSDDLFIEAVWSIELERQFGDQTYINISICKGSVSGYEATVSTH